MHGPPELVEVSIGPGVEEFNELVDDLRVGTTIFAFRREHYSLVL